MRSPCLYRLVLIGSVLSGTSHALSLAPVYLQTDGTAQTVQGGVLRGQLGRMLGTFHERQGDQALLNGTGAVSSLWLRGLGAHTQQDWPDISSSPNGNTASARFRGDTLGGQGGVDLFAFDRGNGHRDHIGLLGGYARTDGTISDLRGIETDQWLNTTSLGVYWTHIGPGNWYLDTVVMGSWGDAEVSSEVGRTKTDVTAFSFSLEGGYPIVLGAHLLLEPQAQIVVQHTDIDAIDVAYGQSYAVFDPDTAISGRFGLRLRGQFEIGSVGVVPYGVVSVWHTLAGKDRMRLLGQKVTTEYGGTSLEARLGLAMRFSQSVSLYVDAGYQTGLDDADQETVFGSLGLRLTW